MLIHIYVHTMYITLNNMLVQFLQPAAYPMILPTAQPTMYAMSQQGYPYSSPVSKNNRQIVFKVA